MLREIRLWYSRLQNNPQATARKRPPHGAAYRIVHKSSPSRGPHACTNSRMHARAYRMHGLDERGDVLGRRELGDPVAEIENVSRAASEGSKDTLSFAADDVRRRGQHGRRSEEHTSELQSRLHLVRR